MKKIFFRYQALSALLFCLFIFNINTACAWQSDNGNGTFTNPVLYADYPDPGVFISWTGVFMIPVYSLIPTGQDTSSADMVRNLS
jgi:hypothetical protein